MITLQNQSKKLYVVSSNRYFKPNDTIAFEEAEAKKLLRYKDIVSLDDIAEKALEAADKASKKAKKAKKASDKVDDKE
jgi:DNA-binding protein H-NS